MKIKTTLKWIFGIASILFALMAFTESNSTIGAISFLISAAFLIPPIFNKINNKLKILRILKIIIPIVGIFYGFVASGISSETENKKGKDEITKFNDPLKIGIDSLKTLIGEKVPYDKWSIWGYPKTLDGTDSNYWVVYLDSANISFVSDKKTDKILFAGFEEKNAINYITNIRTERKKLIEKQLSGWDGSHIQLTKIIKKAMNDPDSYEHDETIYWDMGTHLVVRTSYRGKNIFGGVVRNWIKAKTDIETGTVLEIIEQGQ